jgi:hypothetical protein
MRDLPWLPWWAWVAILIGLQALAVSLILTLLRACDEDLREPQGRVIPGRASRKEAA